MFIIKFIHSFHSHNQNLFYTIYIVCKINQEVQSHITYYFVQEVSKNIVQSLCTLVIQVTDALELIFAYE